MYSFFFLFLLLIIESNNKNVVHKQRDYNLLLINILKLFELIILAYLVKSFPHCFVISQNQRYIVSTRSFFFVSVFLFCLKSKVTNLFVFIFCFFTHAQNNFLIRRYITIKVSYLFRHDTDKVDDG